MFSNSNTCVIFGWAKNNFTLKAKEKMKKKNFHGYY